MALKQTVMCMWYMYLAKLMCVWQLAKLGFEFGIKTVMCKWYTAKLVCVWQLQAP